MRSRASPFRPRLSCLSHPASLPQRRLDEAFAADSASSAASFASSRRPREELRSGLRSRTARTQSRRRSETEGASAFAAAAAAADCCFASLSASAALRASSALSAASSAFAAASAWRRRAPPRARRTLSPCAAAPRAGVGERLASARAPPLRLNRSGSSPMFITLMFARAAPSRAAPVGSSRETPSRPSCSASRRSPSVTPRSPPRGPPPDEPPHAAAIDLYGFFVFEHSDRPRRHLLVVLVVPVDQPLICASSSGSVSARPRRRRRRRRWHGESPEAELTRVADLGQTSSRRRPPRGERPRGSRPERPERRRASGGFLIRSGGVGGGGVFP